MFACRAAWYGRNTDAAGVGLNWAEANGIVGTQFTSEAFYRVTIGSGLQITPSVQYISNPLVDPSQGSITILGLRMRIVF